MALDKTILSVDPTFNDNNGRYGTLFVDPRGVFLTTLVTELDLSELDPPTLAGQLQLVRTDILQLSRLLCSVETSPGVYEWKYVQPITLLMDATTGAEWDEKASLIYSYAR